MSSDTDPDFSIVPVPNEARMPRFGLAMAFWGICSALFFLVISATLATNFGTTNTLIGLVVYIAFCTFITRHVVRFAIRTGLSVDLFSRSVFGKAGGLLATGLFFITATYYAVFEGSVVAVAFAAAFDGLELWHAYLIVVLYSVPLVFGGLSVFLDRLNGILLPFYLIGLVVILYVSIDQYGYSSAWLSLGEAAGKSPTVLDVISVVSLYMGSSVIIMFAWDYARFGKQDDTAFHANLGFGLPFYFLTLGINGVIGIFLAATVPFNGEVSETSTVYAILSLLGMWGLLFIWISQTRINSANFQEATVNFQAFVKHLTPIKISKVSAALIIGAVVFLIMLTDVFSFLLAALAYQGVLVVAWIGIALVHILTSTDAEMMATVENTEPTDGWGLTHPSFLCWCASSTVGVVMLNLDGTASTVAPTATFFVALAGYFLVRRRST